jgi:hypothetical protein
MEFFEIHDHRLFPTFLRDLVTDALQALWDFSNSYKPILPLLRDTLARVGTREVLDLCSGGGGPWFRLARDLESEYHFSINVCLTDKYPNKEALERAHLNSNSNIWFDPRSVQATEVPADLRGFRTMFSSFHHFRAADAREVLADAVERRKGIAIFEMARREPQTLLAICFIPLLILFLTPQIRPFRWSRLLWTYVLPVVPFVLWFDGWMSCLRSYSHEQLSELVRSMSCETYLWELGTQRDGFLPVTYLIGYPASSLRPSEADSRETFTPSAPAWNLLETIIVVNSGTAGPLESSLIGGI